MALCDKKGIKGPQNEYNRHLAELLTIMTDFPKHSKCIDQKEYTKAKKKLATPDNEEPSGYPDFLGKDESKPYESKPYRSELILGKLYRKVDIKGYYDKCINIEY